MMRLVILAALLVLQDSPAGVRSEPYKGWDSAVFLDAPAAKAAAILVPDAGGRIVSYGLGGENLIFDNPDYLGKTLTNTAPAALAQGYLGYNIDLGPETRKIPPHLGLWMGKYAARTLPPGGVILESSHDPAVGMTILKEIAIDPRSGALSLKQTMRNTSDRVQSYCLWDRTLCKGGGFAFFPLNPKSARPQGWSGFKDQKYVPSQHPMVKVIDGVFVAKAEGPSSKFGADPDAGWIAYARGRQLLVKYYPVQADGRYTDGGNTVELYIDPKVCELEPLSPEAALKPGEEYVFPEQWILIPLEREVATHEEARELARKIPANPFKK